MFHEFTLLQKFSVASFKYLFILFNTNSSFLFLRSYLVLLSQLYTQAESTDLATLENVLKLAVDCLLSLGTTADFVLSSAKKALNTVTSTEVVISSSLHEEKDWMEADNVNTVGSMSLLKELQEGVAALRRISRLASSSSSSGIRLDVKKLLPAGAYVSV